MNIESLETFLLLANNHSFSKTAEMQHIVQSTVSARITELERYYGKRLFIRSNRQVSLSQEGLLFLPYAQRMVELIKESQNRIEATDFYKTYLSVGSLDMVWRHTLGDVAQQFMRQNPEVALRVITSYSDDVTQLLIDKTIDIGLLATAPRNTRFSVSPMIEDEIIFAASPKLAISRESSVSVSDLRELPLIYSDLSRDFSLWVEKNLHQSHHFRINIDIVSLMIPFLLRGVGPGFIIKSLVQNELDSGQLVAIPVRCETPLPPWIIYAAFEKGNQNADTIRKFLSLFPPVSSQPQNVDRVRGISFCGSV